MQNEARYLRDDSIINLVESAEKMNGTKNLLRKISDQEINNFENIEKNKGKRYWERYKTI